MGLWGSLDSSFGVRDAIFLLAKDAATPVQKAGTEVFKRFRVKFRAAPSLSHYKRCLIPFIHSYSRTVRQTQGAVVGNALVVGFMKNTHCV